MEIIEYLNIPDNIKEIIKRANVFFQPVFAEYIHLQGEMLYLAYDDERIVPIRHRKNAFFNFGVFPSEPFQYVDCAKRKECVFLDEVVKITSKKLHVQWINSTAACFFYDTPREKCKRIPFGSHVIDLSKSEEDLWKEVHSKHRNVIRKAEKESVIIKKGRIELLNDYVLLERQTQDRTGRKASGIEYYRKQLNALDNNIIIYIAYKNNDPQAGAIFYYNKRMCYYMYGATGGGIGYRGSKLVDLDFSY